MIISHFTDIQSKIISELITAKKEIKVAVCWFTCTELFDVLCEKLKYNINVILIVLNDSINNRPDGLNFQKFVDLGGEFYFSDIENPMHNKYCIIDDEILINGSYNWTFFAETKNFENITILKDEIKTVDEFINDFNRIKSSCMLIRNVSEAANTDTQIFGIVENTRVALKDDIIIKNKKEIGNKQLKLIASLGENIHNNVFYVFFSKGTNIPISKTHTLTTVSDNQTICNTDIRFGENNNGSLNSLIGKFNVENIPPLPKGKAGLITTFSIDEYCILTVSIKVRETGNLTIYKYNIQHIIS